MSIKEEKKITKSEEKFNYLRYMVDTNEFAKNVYLETLIYS